MLWYNNMSFNLSESQSPFLQREKNIYTTIFTQMAAMWISEMACCKKEDFKLLWIHTEKVTEYWKMWKLIFIRQKTENQTKPIRNHPHYTSSSSLSCILWNSCLISKTIRLALNPFIKYSFNHQTQLKIGLIPKDTI